MLVRSYEKIVRKKREITKRYLCRWYLHKQDERKSRVKFNFATCRTNFFRFLCTQNGAALVTVYRIVKLLYDVLDYPF